MSKTPRSDAERRRLKREKTWPSEPVDVDFARELERELNEWKERAENALGALSRSLDLLDDTKNKLNEARAESLAWQGNCERMAEQHAELSKELGEARSLNAELVREMERYLPILQQLSEHTSLWDSMAQGTGIATINGYLHKIEKAKEAK